MDYNKIKTFYFPRPLTKCRPRLWILNIVIFVKKICMPQQSQQKNVYVENLPKSFK